MNGLFLVTTVLLTNCLIVKGQSVTHYCTQGNTESIREESGGRIITRKQGQPHYSDNLNCAWIIDAGLGSRIKLTILSLDLQWSPSYALCSGYDSLTIRDGQTDSDTLIAQVCFSLNPQQIVSPGRYLHLHFFTTDKNFYNHAGITVQFEVFGEAACPPGWKSLTTTDRCYSIYEKPTGGTTYSKAQQTCRFSQANLAIIETQDEFTKIQDYANDEAVKTIWIGLTDLASEGSYKWLDGSALQLTQKLDGSSASKSKDCIAHNVQTQKWQSHHCTKDTYMFICEKLREGTTPTYTVPDEGEDDEGKGNVTMLWAVLFGVLGGITCVFAAIAVYCCCCRRKKSESSWRQGERREMNQLSQRSTRNPGTSSTQPASEQAIRLTPAIVEPTAPPPYEANNFPDVTSHHPPSYDQVLAEDKAPV